MRNILLFLLFIFLSFQSLKAQEKTHYDPKQVYVIILINNNDQIGHITAYNKSIIELKPLKGDTLQIPRYEIKEIRKVRPGEITGRGKYYDSEIFKGSYFFSKNYLPYYIDQKKRLKITPIGYDFSFRVGNHIELGASGTYTLIPAIGHINYRHQLVKGINIGLGMYVGGILFAEYSGIMPKATITLGDSKSNLSFGASYIKLFGNEDLETPVYNISGMSRLSSKASFVFENYFITSYQAHRVGVIMPGFRVSTSTNSALDFMAAIIYYDTEIFPVPIPVVQYLQKF